LSGSVEQLQQEVGVDLTTSYIWTGPHTFRDTVTFTSPSSLHPLQLQVNGTAPVLTCDVPIRVSDMYIGANFTNTVSQRLIALETTQQNNGINTALNYTWTGNHTFQNIVCQSIESMSDVRLKQNIRDISDAESSKLQQLSCYSYQFKDNPSQTHYGVIAQEVKELWPELVHVKKNNEQEDILTVDYQSLCVLLLHEVQRLKRDIMQFRQQERFQQR
jgi:hypothetical protein